MLCISHVHGRLSPSCHVPSLHWTYPSSHIDAENGKILPFCSMGHDSVWQGHVHSQISGNLEINNFPRVSSWFVSCHDSNPPTHVLLYINACTIFRLLSISDTEDIFKNREAISLGRTLGMRVQEHTEFRPR